MSVGGAEGDIGGGVLHFPLYLLHGGRCGRGGAGWRAGEGGSVDEGGRLRWCERRAGDGTAVVDR